jgi:hypothetical protein
MTDETMPTVRDFAIAISKARATGKTEIVFSISQAVYANLKKTLTGREWESDDTNVAMSMMGAHFVHDETLTGNAWRQGAR